METVVIPPKDSDLDGLACAYAYSRFIKTDFYFQNLFIEPSYMVQRFGIEKPEKKDWDGFILMDMSSVHGLPDFVDSKKVLSVIDHRESGIKNTEKYFPKAKSQIELVGACATLITEKMIETNYPVDKVSANLLFSAIFSNTLNLRSSNTTERDLDAIEWLRKTGKVIDGIPIEVFKHKKSIVLKNLELAISEDFKPTYKIDGMRLGISQLELYGAENIVNRSGEAVEILRKLKDRSGLSLIFLNVPDTENGVNYYIVENKKIKEILSKKIEIEFINERVGKGKLLLRKQIEKILNLDFV